MAWNLFSILFTLNIIYFIGETYCRFFLDTTDSFAISKISQRWTNNHVKFNNANLRDNVDYDPQIKKKRRLSILGDSFTMGHGITDPDDRFGNILRKRFPDLEVHNIAFRGASSVSQLNAMKVIDSIGYEYDMVLLAYCLNDIDHFRGVNTLNTYRRIQLFESRLPLIAKESYFLNTIAFRYFALNEKDFMEYSNTVLEDYAGSAWHQQKEALTELTKHIESKNGKLVVMVFPFLQVDSADYKFYEVHDKLSLHFDSLRVPQINLLPIYKSDMGNDLTVNNFDAHPNEKAHQLAANEISRFLEVVLK